MRRKKRLPARLRLMQMVEKWKVEIGLAKVGDTITLPACTKDGYEFVGWYDGDTCIGKAGEDTLSLPTLTLKARYEKKEDEKLSAPLPLMRTVATLQGKVLRQRKAARSSFRPAVRQAMSS